MLNDRELAAVLAGLRLFQALDDRGGGITLSVTEGADDIATGGDKFQSLSFDELDALCERLNSTAAAAESLASQVRRFLALQDQVDSEAGLDDEIYSHAKKDLRAAVARQLGEKVNG